jgi:excisionase family DNA binding protein
VETVCSEDDGELLTAEGAACLLKISFAAIWRLANDGRLPRVRIGRSVRFRRADLLALAGLNR